MARITTQDGTVIEDGESQAPAPQTTPCGGCGAQKDSERCIGCVHDFGDAESAWVRQRGEKLHALRTVEKVLFDRSTKAEQGKS